MRSRRCSSSGAVRDRAGGGRGVFSRGEELSLLALCDGTTAVPLASAQDYKRIYRLRPRPEHGGMGS